jgi:hypothetical protein
MGNIVLAPQCFENSIEFDNAEIPLRFAYILKYALRRQNVLNPLLQCKRGDQKAKPVAVHLRGRSLSAAADRSSSLSCL